MNFKDTLKLVKRQKKLIYFVSIFFLVFILLGLVFPDFLGEEINRILEEILAQVEGKSLLGTIAFIIDNNVRAALISIVLGIIFFPVLSTIVNGFVIGSVLANAIYKSNILVVWKLLPHGIFEIPAIIIAYTFGLKIGLSLLRPNRIKNLKKAYKEAFFVFIFIILPLLLIAGIIEGALFYFAGA